MVKRRRSSRTAVKIAASRRNIRKAQTLRTGVRFGPKRKRIP